MFRQILFFLDIFAKMMCIYQPLDWGEGEGEGRVSPATMTRFDLAKGSNQVVWTLDNYPNDLQDLR